MMHFKHTVAYRKCQTESKDSRWLVERLCESQSPAEMIVNCAAFGFSERLPANESIVALGTILERYCSHQDGRTEYPEVHVKALVEAAETTHLFDNMFSERTFWNMCSDYVGRNCRFKGPRKCFLRVVRLMGIAEKRISEDCESFARRRKKSRGETV